jgi:hypothetical protein
MHRPETEMEEDVEILCNQPSQKTQTMKKIA